jgi:uncharacterized protein YaeQ
VKELKKYPFSKKALNAMLAATVALSPIVTTGIAFQPTKVEAATTLSDAYNRVKLIYSKLTAEQKAEYRKVAQGLTQFTKEDWKSVLTTEQAAKMKAALEGRNVTPEEVIEKFTLLVYGTTSKDIEDKLATYKQSPAFIEFERVMGDGTTDLIVQFVMDAEKEVWKKAPSEILNAVLTGSIAELTVEIRDNLIKNNAAYAKLNSDIGTKLGTSLEGIFDINDRILVKLVSKNLLTSTELTSIKKSFIDAAFAAGNPNPPVVVDPGPGPGPGTPVDQENPGFPIGSTVITKNPSPTPGGKVEVETTVPEDKVTGLVNLITAENNNTLSINLQKPAAGEVVLAKLPASLFTEATKKNGVIEINTEGASYKLPASEINIADLATKLGVPAADLKIIVSVNEVEVTDIKGVVSKVIEFKVEAVSATKSEELKSFSKYVERTINGENNFDSNKSVGVKVNDDGTLTSVPTLFNDGNDKDKASATIKSLTNSKYTIVKNDITFSDVNKKWHEKQYIETLANKLIIQGKTDSQGKPDGTFAPGEDMTRAQFTTMLVKALALPSKKSEKAFSDVKESDWFKEALDTAVEYEIISGKPDGRFAPNESVTRSQVAIMLQRAMQIKFINNMTKVNTDKKEFTDVAKLDEKTKAAIEAIYKAGIISGKPDGTFDPNGNTLRNQMAKMLAKFLISAKLMNEIK